MQKEAIEPTGLIPRSIIRTFDRFVQQLLPGSESVAIQEYKVSRYQIFVSIKSLCLLICVPLLVNCTVKSFILTPLIEYFWNSQQNQIFLNSYQEKRAFEEMQEFSQKIFFESLLKDKKTDFNENSIFDVQPNNELFSPKEEIKSERQKQLSISHIDQIEPFNKFFFQDESSPNCLLQEQFCLQRMFQLKSLEIADKYNKQSILAITNILGDFLTFFTLYILFVIMKPQIIILKSFLTESIYSLSDTTKSFLLILVMDLLVGFHSPRGWEIALESVLRHLGLPENENFILLFVALFPVFLDTVFKYWIFRFLNKISPSTVVTYHSMLE